MATEQKQTPIERLGEGVVMVGVPNCGDGADLACFIKTDGARRMSAALRRLRYLTRARAAGIKPHRSTASSGDLR